jgi:hypothetical protein
VQEDCTLELHLEEGLPAVAVPSHAPRFFEHLVAFVRDVALARDPIRIVAQRELDSVRVTVTAETQADAGEVLRIIDTASPASGVRRFLEECGGGLLARVEDGALTLAMLLPAVQQG